MPTPTDGITTDDRRAVVRQLVRGQVLRRRDPWPWRVLYWCLDRVAELLAGGPADARHQEFVRLRGMTRRELEAHGAAQRAYIQRRMEDLRATAVEVRAVARVAWRRVKGD